MSERVFCRVVRLHNTTRGRVCRGVRRGRHRRGRRRRRRGRSARGPVWTGRDDDMVVVVIVVMIAIMSMIMIININMIINIVSQCSYWYYPCCN